MRRPCKCTDSHRALFYPETLEGVLGGLTVVFFLEHGYQTYILVIN